MKEMIQAGTGREARGGTPGRDTRPTRGKQGFGGAGAPGVLIGAAAQRRPTRGGRPNRSGIDWREPGAKAVHYDLNYRKMDGGVALTVRAVSEQLASLLATEKQLEKLLSARRRVQRLQMEVSGVSEEVRELVNALFAASAAVFGEPECAVRARGRRQNVAEARMTVAYLARQTGAHSTDVARAMGLSNHTTVLHAAQRIATLVEVDKKLAARVAKVKEKAVVSGQGR